MEALLCILIVIAIVALLCKSGQPPDEMGGGWV